MERIMFVRALKKIIEEKGSCYTKTTEKKGEGFIPYNIHDVKWGQIDVEDRRIRVVIDLYPGRYKEEELSDSLGLTPKSNKRSRVTGFYFEKEEQGLLPPFHDVVTFTLYNEFFGENDSILNGVIEFVDKAASESSFKTDYPYKIRKK